MKKRILSILLLCCMVLTLLPTTAFAAGKIWVGTEEELLAALADNTIDKITLTADITVSQTLVIDRQVVLVLDHSLKVDWEQSSSGTLFHITKSGYLDTDAGSITDNVLNEGRFYPLQISGEVINEGEIIRGSFSGKVKNRGSINNGSFRGEVENDRSGKITDGEFYGEVTNHGEISGREFYGKVTNEADGIISYGKFYGDVVNNGTITGGSFFGTLTGNEIQGDLYRTVTFDSDGGSAVTPQQVLQGQKVQRPADPIKDGHTFIGWYNKDDLQYVNMPEWNFDYPVFENLELVAQWMEAMPISADPVAYLDENGQTKYCTKYSVLTSETKESILDYDDKWYDLPAGWYVVEGNVTITPRVDTHGAVNLILTNGSHLTAEWGIDVKVGDTFTVYAQSTDEGTMGRLTACLPADFNLDRMVHYSVWPDSGMAGIGSSARWRAGNDGIRESEGTIVINGGNIRAKGQDNASAIGGTRASDIEFRSTDSGEVYNRRQGGGITINGGVVRTEPFALPEGNPLAVDSVGIGTCQMGYGGSVTINGGTVIAEAANDAITTGDGGTITINGGDVTARGGVNNFGENSHRVLSGNGIGPYESGSVIINGGTVKATAKGEGFGIGGARIYNTGAMTVTINDGEIEATANHNNAAIGDKGNGKSGVTINGGVIHAVGKGGAAGIGSKGDIRITGGELTVSAEGSGAAIGGFTDSYSERVDCKSITINGDVIKSISSKDGACIGGAAGGSVGSITISDAELPLLSSEKVLIGWDADSPGGKLTIRNCRVESTDIPTTHTDGIRVGSNSEIVIENSEIRLPHLRGIRVGGNGSIAVRDSDLHTYGIFMDETVQSPNDAKTLKKLEITGSTVLTGDIIGARGDYSSVEEIVIRGSSIRLNDEYTYNYCTIGGGTGGSFGSIDIQDSQIDITSSLNAPIGSGLRSSTDRESRIRIANSQVSVRNLKFGPAIGSGYTSHGGRMDIIIENSTVTAKGGDLRSSTDYIPGIGKNASGCKTVIGIQILNSTVDSFRLTEKGGTDYVYDDLHTKELPGIPAENISICGSTVNGKTIDHSFDEYGKCTLCGKYDLGYCYEHGLLTMEGLTGCVSDGSEKKLTGLSHKTGENETKQLTENTDYTASYSNNVHPYTLAPDDVGFDPAKAPKVTLYGAGNYCGKAEHYFTISENAAAAPSITTSSLPDGKVGEAYSQILTATGTTPITWSIIGALPDGLSLNKDTGKISGTPTAAGSSTFTVKATNSAGSDTKELSITITKDAPPSHEHSYGDWSKDGTSHWHECTDTDCPNREESITDKAAHVYTDDTDTTCDVCGYERTVTPPSHEHSYGDWSRDGTNHWHECTDDDCPNREESINDKAAHVYTDDADTTCDVCGYERTVTPPPHEHSYGDWRKDGTSHWHECTDDDCPDREESIKDKAAHVYTDDADTTCDTCGYERTITPPAHEHRYGDWRKDGTNHWHECTDADCPNREESIKDKAAHVYTDDADTTCDTCGYERTITPPAHEHRYGDWRKDGTNHWHECTDADCPNREESIKDKAAHVYTDDADTTCDTCGYERTITPPAHEHRYGDWRKDGTNHWHECTDADCPNREESIKDKAAHVYDNDADTTCNTCGYERTVTPPAHEHIVTFDGNGGTSSVGSMTTTNQKLTSLPSASRSGSYSFDGWYTKKNGGTEITTDTEFPADTTVYAHWTYTGGGGSSGYSYYTIKATAGAGGSISPSGNVSVREGRDQTFTITPDKGYAVANVKIDGKSIGAVKSYTFENVRRTHTIEVIFMKANGNPQTGVFVDVATGSYYEDAVDWAVENGITKGTDDTHFSPDGICTRAQAVTFLWRAAGSPEPETRAMPFTDVPVGSYYYDAVLWAVENGITKGTSDTTFSPNMTCTRAQIVAFLWRSEKSPAAGTANPFADVKSTAYYADAVLWAVKENITKGTTSTTFSPNADCTRAQIVTFLWRCKK
ncbi:MAG: S-layer homology domain-containing protein [Oscillospiraceae bacterium]